MEWINLHQSTLSAPEYLRSVPSERGTWLNLLAYCCQQENGGFIADCSDWKDRTWQQIAGITRREVRANCRLWEWVDTGLRIFAYPVEKEQELKVERAAGRLGGLTKQKNKLLAAIPQDDLPTLLPTLEGMPLPAQVATLQASLLRKGREGKGKEGNEERESTAPAPLNSVLASQIDAVATSYCRQDAPLEVRSFLAEDMDAGASYEDIRRGVNECMSHIREAPGGSSNQWVPKALTFFQQRQWRSPEAFAERWKPRANGQGGKQPIKLTSQPKNGF